MQPYMTHLAHNLLLGLDRGELVSLVAGLDEPAYRAQQLLDGIYRKRLESIDRISTFPQALRSKLVGDGYTIGLPAVEKRFVSIDGTVRYLIALTDGQSVETVWMPSGDGGEAGDGTEAGDAEERFAGNYGPSPSAAKAAADFGALTARLEAAPLQSNVEDRGGCDVRGQFGDQGGCDDQAEVSDRGKG